MQKMLFSKLLTAPSFKLPPIWMIKSTCPGQFIALNPIDADGDKIKCRWATETEADSAFYIESVWPSLSLDQDNCIVHYDGIFDPFGQGLKPIALMIEDFDQSDNVKSSTPIQFLAQVWTPLLASPSTKSSRTQTLERNNNCWPHCYPVIPHDENDSARNDEIKSRKARTSDPNVYKPIEFFVAPSLPPLTIKPLVIATWSTTTSTTAATTTTTFTTTTYTTPTVEPAAYCDPLIGPVFDDSIVSPDGTEFIVRNGHVDLTLAAISEIGIAMYTYQGPLGFTCSAVDQKMVII